MLNGFEERLKYICILQGSFCIWVQPKRDDVTTSSLIGWVHTQNDPSFNIISGHWGGVGCSNLPPHGRQGPIYPTLSKSWPMMTWLFALPGHQQPWYWPCSSGILWGNETIIRPSYLYNENSYTGKMTGCLYWLSPLVCPAAGQSLNTLRQKQNGRHFPDDIFK